MQNETKTDFQPTFSASPIERRARQYASIFAALYGKNGISGKVQPMYRAARYIGLDVRLSNPMQLAEALKLSEPLALACGVGNIQAKRDVGLVAYQIELPGALWEYYTRQDLPTPAAIGLGERRRPVVFRLDPPHCLVAGATQTSGKSTTVKSILMSLIQTHAVSDLGIVICDPHGDYTDFQNEAHLIRFDFGSIARSPAQIATALAWAGETMRYRLAEDIRDDRTIVIVVDEAESVLTGDNLTIAQSIAKESAKTGMHLIIATQKPSQKALPLIVDNCLNRYVGQLADANLSARISGHSGLLAHKLTSKGDFLHISNKDATRFQVAMATKADFDRLERVEVAPVEVAPVDVVEIPSTKPAARPAGRPKLETDMDWLAYYAFADPTAISRNMATEQLGLSRDFHELHRDASKEFIKAYLRLVRQNLNLGFMVKAMLSAGRSLGA